jgi:hypothetical protein
LMSCFVTSVSIQMRSMRLLGAPVADPAGPPPSATAMGPKRIPQALGRRTHLAQGGSVEH